MHNKQQIPRNLASKIGELFYVIANSDGRVTELECLSLQSFIKSSWRDYDESCTRLILHQFKEAFQNNLPTEDCFNEFVEFMHRHANGFSENLKQLVLKTARAIAYSYAKLNKSELHYLVRLSIEFKKVNGK